MRMTILLALALAALPHGASAAADEAAAKKLATGFSAAWSKGDAAAIAAFYAPDAVLTTPEGKTARGRDAIREAFAADLRDNKGSKMAFSAHEFRELGAGAMAWRCEWKATGLKGPLPTMTGTGLAVLVADKDGWLIAEDVAALTPPTPKESKAKSAGHGHEHGPGGHDHGDGGHDHGPGGHTH